MKKEYITRYFRVKHTDGVKYRGDFFKYYGKSRLDGLPIFSCKTEIGIAPNWKLNFKYFIFNCRPGYTPTSEDFELIPSQDWMPKSIGDDLVPIQPVKFPPPIGLLYYLDYVYEESLDERLILML